MPERNPRQTVLDPFDGSAIMTATVNSPFNDDFGRLLQLTEARITEPSYKRPPIDRDQWNCFDGHYPHDWFTAPVRRAGEACHVLETAPAHQHVIIIIIRQARASTVEETVGVGFFSFSFLPFFLFYLFFRGGGGGGGGGGGQFPFTCVRSVTPKANSQRKNTIEIAVDPTINYFLRLVLRDNA